MDPKRQCVLTRANYSVIKMRGVYAKWAAMHGINYNQVLVLYTIRESGFCTQKQVCSNFLLPPQTIHNVISAMRKDGLLRISPENCTGREKAFVLTEKGAGAAYATVIGQCVSAVITGLRGFHMPPAIREMPHYIKNIYRLGYPSMSMQMMYTIYIAILNMILATFSNAAVTVLGLYYKAQSFFFIPLLGMQTCIVPVLSYNFTRGNYLRCRQTMRDSLFISLAFMALGIVCFIFLPGPVISIFSNSADVLAIGKIAFPIIGTSFASAVFSLMLPVFFYAIGSGPKSVLLSLTRQIFVLMPVFWALSRIGLNYSWLAFPIAETVAGAVGLVLYKIQLKQWGVDKPIKQLETAKAGA